MTKSDLIEQLAASRMHMPAKDVEAAIKEILEQMASTLQNGDRIEIRGFGSFINKKRAKKIARNISKNTSITIEEHYVPSFKPAKVFVEQIKTSTDLAK